MPRKIHLTRRFELMEYKKTGRLPARLPSVSGQDRTWCGTKQDAAHAIRTGLVGYIADLNKETGPRQAPRCKHMHGGAKFFLHEGDKQMARGRVCMATGDYVNGIRWAGAAAACIRTDASCPAPGAINVVKYGRE